MPIYEYACKSCNHTLDALQKMNDDPLTECPECGKEIRRLIGGGMGVIFKGSGFYVTDNRSGSNGGSKDAGKGSSDSKDSGRKSDSSSFRCWTAVPIAPSMTRMRSSAAASSTAAVPLALSSAPTVPATES